jgi:hypothetical protein
MAFSATMVWEVRQTGADSNGGGFRGGAALATPSAPALAASAGGAVAAGTYYVVVSQTDGNGETPMSPATSIVITTSNTITVTAPTNPSSQGATWNVYVGTVSGGPYFLQGNVLLFGSNRVIAATPPTSGTQAPGVDYSQQDAAQVTYTDLVIGATTTQLTSVANPFSSASVGNIINVTGGTGFTVQRLEIIGFTASGLIATCDKSAGTAASSGGAGKLGGALASPALAAGQSSAGNGIFVKYSATPYQMSASTNVANGSISSSNPKWIVGYDTTRNRANTDANRPTFQASANGVTFVNGTVNNSFLTNIIFDANAHASCTGTTWNGNSALIRRCKALNCATGFNNNNGAALNVACEANGCTTGFTGSGGFYYEACAAISCGTVGFSTGAGSCVLVGCLATGCGTNFIASGSRCVYVNCTASSSTAGAGFQVNSSGPWATFANCVAYSNHSYGFAGQTDDGELLSCAAGANVTAATQNVVSARNLGFITLTASPFTNAAGNDFSLNTTAGGGALLRAAGYPATLPGLSTASALDVGAAQHADPASVAGGTKSHVGRRTF